MRLNRIGLLVFAVISIAITATAVAAAIRHFSGNGTGSTTLSYYITQAEGDGVPRVQYVNVTSDKAASVLKFYSAGTGIILTGDQASTTNFTCVGTTFASNDVVVLRDVSAGTYERVVIYGSTASNATTQAAITGTYGAGDYAYEMTAAGQFAVGNATVEKNAGAGAIWNGTELEPTLIEVDGTSACKINAISGIYE